MTLTVEPFLKGRNNLIKLTLLENGQPVPNLQLATQIDIVIGPYLTITRFASGNGVDFSQGNGLLVINPGGLIEDVSSIPDQQVDSAIIVYDTANTMGVQFGGADSDPKLAFSVRPSRV